MKKKSFILLSIMVIIILSTVLITRLIDREEEKEEDTYTIVTSFYPMYVLTKNLVKDIDGIEVINLTDYESGCLHDYQLTTQDMKRLEHADLFIMNGGGMESFIEEVLISYPQLPVINASEGIQFLESTHDHSHDDDHGHEDSDAHEDDQNHEDNDAHDDAQDHEDSDTHDDDQNHEDSDAHDNDQNHEGSDTHEDDQDHEDSDTHEDDHAHTENNAHVWLNTDYYQIQIENVATGLSTYNQENETIFKENKTAYIDQIKALQEELETELADLKGKEIVIFHDAFVYLANQLGLSTVHIVNMDSESSLSAGEVAEVIDEVNSHQIKILFTEEQYSTTIADSISKETGAKVYVIDSLVKGAMNETGYLEGMKYNLNILKEVIKDTAN